MAHPTGEAKRQGLGVEFDCGLKLAFHGSKVSSDFGSLAYGKLDDAPGQTGPNANAN